ncbi:hypothetical protein NP233_g9292 [Leucocoprinus birnbaumii]|uniref:Cytochrome P450 n=1 Tax=Leucocoprinus birnbaumii TaxID=56174 RepID=A0AAD5VKX9_9AGAR|nr:hypothetical protein NP233_g9292 [Leucocoprinus birnbaumii]
MKTLFAGITLCAVVYAWRRRGQRKKRCPPGPRRWPLIGNLFDLPTTHSHEEFAKMSKELGSDIVYLDAAGVPFIILNSLEACNDLLEKRASVYSSRFTPTMVYDLIEGRRLVALMPYGNEWREGRRMMIKHMSATQNQEPIKSSITDFVKKSLLPNLLATPEDFLIHIRNGVGGSMISLAYGLPIKRTHDPWIDIAEQAMHALTSAAVPGKYAVDVIPWLRYLPEWVPGTGFQREAREWKGAFLRMFSEPFAAVKKGMVDGSIRPSFLSRSLEEVSESKDRERLERVIENIGGTFIGGGTDTGVTAVTNLIVALLLFPSVQKRAQKELDAVIGRSRLPSLEDKPNLPYLNALVKELFRWKPIVPLGLPHMTTEEDEYRGYHVPKGAVVIGNSWAILHDEKVFPDPEKFDPERFLEVVSPDGHLIECNKNLPDPEEVCTFGFGRRTCPGKDIALANVWLSAACILACFNISSHLDANGDEIAPEVEYLGKEAILHPEPFECRIAPRDDSAKALIRAEFDESKEYI